MKPIKHSDRRTRAGGKVALAWCALAAGTLALAGCGVRAGTASTGGSPASSSPASARGQVGSTSVTAKQTPAAGHSAPAAGHSAPAAPAGFQVLSMTFVSDQRGFALGTVKCGTRRCVSLLGTANGGATWARLTAPAKRPGGIFNTCPSGSACVSQVRFATPLVGYAFDPSLFLTTDGGRHWKQDHGLSVTSLEISGGTAIRVASAGEGCSGMPYKVQSAPVGTTAWHALSAPQILTICPPALYRQGTRVVLAGYGNPAGGVRATAQITRSGNDGATWSGVRDSCGGKDGYASGLAIAPPDVLVLICHHQMPARSGSFGPAWVRVSVNGGASFAPDRVVSTPSGLPKAPAGGILGYQLAAASQSRLLVTTTSPHGNLVLLSNDGGRTWSARLRPSGAGSLLLVGFEDPVTARVAQGDRVWTTRDGGSHWTADSFPG